MSVSKGNYKIITCSSKFIFIEMSENRLKSQATELAVSYCKSGIDPDFFVKEHIDSTIGKCKYFFISYLCYLLVVQGKIIVGRFIPLLYIYICIILPLPDFDNIFFDNFRLKLSNNGKLKKEKSWRRKKHFKWKTYWVNRIIATKSIH